MYPECIYFLSKYLVVFQNFESMLKLSFIAVSRRLIYDPVTGKSRGFGFCEYEDAETAMSAVRNLAGREVNGRPLRIDSAANAPGGGGGGFGGGGVGEVNRPGANRPQGNVEVSEDYMLPRLNYS